MGVQYIYIGAWCTGYLASHHTLSLQEQSFEPPLLPPASLSSQVDAVLLASYPNPILEELAESTL
jgi:hypothetical protein